MATPALLVIGLGFAYGGACWLLPQGRRDWLTLALTTFAMSLGGLTLLMFWIAVLSPGHLSLALILGGCVVLGGVGLGLARGAIRPGRQPVGPWTMLLEKPLPALLLMAVVLLCCGIVFNALYWPFEDGDALAVYAPLGKTIYQTGALPIGNRLYEGYPMLIPLAYAYTHWARGGVDEQLPRLLAALTAVGAVATAGALASELRSARAGLIAAGFVVLTPVFCRWSSSGYTDVPASFFTALTALHAWRWWQGGDARSSALTGLSAGLAMWTKNSSLTLVVSLAALVGLRWRAGRRCGAAGRLGPLRWGAVGVMATAAALTAGPWYVRNAIVFQFLVPDTMWTHLARRTADTLLVLAWGHGFGVPGWFYSAGAAYATVRLLWRNETWDAWAVSLAFVAPFVGAWWWLASYDPRLLMTVVPLLAVMAAIMVDEAMQASSSVLSPVGARRVSWAAALGVLALAPWSARKAVDHKWVILKNPWASDAEKHRVRLGGLYDVALAINGLPAGSRLGGVPSMARYHIALDRLARVDERALLTPPCALVEEYDFVVYRFDASGAPSWSVRQRPMLRTEDGYNLYPTQGSEACSPAAELSARSRSPMPPRGGTH